jgi:hypothetical protein
LEYNGSGDTLAAIIEAGGVAMLGALRHRTHHFGDLIYTTIESAFLTAGAVLIFLALLVVYFGLLMMKG